MDSRSDINKESPSPAMIAARDLERTTPKNVDKFTASEVTTRKSRREYYELEKRSRKKRGGSDKSPDNLDTAIIPERQSPTTIPMPMLPTRHGIDHPLNSTKSAKESSVGGGGLYDHRYMSPPPVTSTREPTPRSSKRDERPSVESEVIIIYFLYLGKDSLNLTL